MPSDFEKNTKGYCVEYEDGYQSWSPADVFEKAYKVAETPIDRMHIEHTEESERYQKGADFIKSQTFSKLNYLARTLLSAQNETQREYLYLLQDRIATMSNQTTTLGEFDFGTAVKFLKAGGAVRRAEWKKGLPPIIPAFPNYIPTKRVEYNSEYNLVYILTKDCSVAVTDGAFYDIVSKYTWDKDSKGYISASFKDKDGFHPHRLQNYIIPDIPSGYILDHINGNKLDNRTCNLRLATIKENCANRSSKIGSSSIYKGVSFDSGRKKWISSIQIEGKTKHIGRFDDEREAAIAYDAEAFKVYGEFARLNFPKLFEAPFVVKQIPAHITKDVIPNMQSLPQIAKDILMARSDAHIDYTNQMLIINPDGRADSWVPSSSDVFAEDWELVTQ